MNFPTIEINGRPIGKGYPVYVIAEAGANHNGDLSIAKQMVDVAKEVGADCIKFQTFTAEEFLASRSKQFTYKSQGVSVTESEFEMFKRLEFSRDQWIELISYCEARQIQFLTTVQDPVNLELMLGLGLKGIKVGSDDFDHLGNLRKYAETGLPLIISKGMADLAEVDMVVNAIEPIATGGLAVLHCVSLYPCDARYLNLSQLTLLQNRYPNVVWGFSDHSPSTVAPALAVSLGAKIVEKHFTLSHDMAGPDHWFSMDPAEMKEMVENIRFAEEALGNGLVSPSDEESKVRQIMRRRAVARKLLQPGDELSEENVTFKRAEYGVFAGEWDLIRGKTMRTGKQVNEPIGRDDIE